MSCETSKYECKTAFFQMTKQELIIIKQNYFVLLIKLHNRNGKYNFFSKV